MKCTMMMMMMMLLFQGRIFRIQFDDDGDDECEMRVSNVWERGTEKKEEVEKEKKSKKKGRKMRNFLLVAATAVSYRDSC